MTTKTRETTIEGLADRPAVRIVRDFAATPDLVFRAWTDHDLAARWLGPKDLDMRIHTWDARTGGSYHYTMWRGAEQVAEFYGSFHEVRTPSRLVQTFTYLGMPDDVSLEINTFEAIDGLTRVTSLSLYETYEARDAMLSSGMEIGVVEGYAALDELLR
ncbi:SRPBCC family protein [Saccharomonospora sp. NB11]|uniref:SRPBCC family protein n=1 Tax=Saccharomonospora sp. NB11 TaxID=1642298 RepID=UPI0018D11945|nr:SRPBCC family protein [Saccharomonospora sp. NB11]